MSEQDCSSTSRPYRMGRRAEHVEATRQRIVDAAVQLHSTIGPARTTISALAETAGVTRLTVYRHFPDDDELYAACSQRWEEIHAPGPDPAAWRGIRDLEARTRHALGELYAWYHDVGDALRPILRDVDAAALPEVVCEETDEEFARYADALVTGSGVRGAGRRRLRAVAGHAVSFWTWQSLTVEQRLSHGEAVELMTSLMLLASGHTDERAARR